MYMCIIFVPWNTICHARFSSPDRVHFSLTASHKKRSSGSDWLSRIAQFLPSSLPFYTEARARRLVVRKWQFAIKRRCYRKGPVGRLSVHVGELKCKYLIKVNPGQVNKPAVARDREKGWDGGITEVGGKDGEQEGTGKGWKAQESRRS